ncbi:LacI family DNA-binding transcriptional regulator [Runella limosa]|uniref:LacI family DNA-binding transcriptional regulator n=1 Tax=Runella limosa TaxID=370978 RepID=UPI000426DD02|nr:LacI family DNA-binding transcriptional regulator [Runella limosa]
MNEITLKTIADQLGLSISTVSRALKNHPDIKQATKQKVVALAQQLDYEPNSLAAQLLQRKSKTIGVVVPKILYPLYALAITGIEDIITQHGYQVVICQTQESYAKEVEQIKRLLSFRVSGIILSISAYTTQYEHLYKVIRKNTPLVLFNRDCQEVECSKVLIDNHKAAYEAVRVFLELNKNRIAYIGGPTYLQISQRRLYGYQKALEDANLDLNLDYIKLVDFEKQSIDEAIHQLLALPTPPNAILTFSDQIAQATIVVAKQKGFSIPHDLAVIGFNNERADELMTPTLSSIDQPAYQMGVCAAELILKQLSSEQPLSEQIILKSTLIRRQSA